MNKKKSGAIGCIGAICIMLLGIMHMQKISAAGNGQTKFIVTTNDNVSPVKIQTERGSFLMDGINSPRVGLIFDQDHWNTLTDQVTWFSETQQGAKLTGLVGPVGPPAGQQGYSTALSTDGNTLAIGAPTSNGGIGGIFIFTRTAGVWTQEGPQLVGTGAVGNAYQGRSVALSADGNTLASGGIGDGGGTGAVWIFTRTAGVWTQEGSKLVGTGAVGNAQQGWSIALSGDGNTLASGGIGDGGGTGAVWIFTRTAGVWTQEGSKLVGSGAVDPAYQGSSAALSADGNTLATGGPGDNTDIGAVWIFIRTGDVWTQQGAKLVGTGAVGNAQQGWSIALSGDGNTLAEGGYGDDSDTGAVWIFTRTAGVWTQEGSKLVGTGAVDPAYQGWSIALSGDGNTLAEGGVGDSSLMGAVWIFTRTAGVWTQEGSKLVGTGAVGNARQGWSIALSGDGNTLASGGNGDDSNAGAIWIFTRTAGVWTQEGNKLIGGVFITPEQQGACIALSADGNTLAAGGPTTLGNKGAITIFTRTGNTWALQKGFIGSGAVDPAYQGSSAALSADGNTLATGGPGDNTDIGAVWIFIRTGDVWTQQGAKLVGTGAATVANQGSSISLSRDGNTLASGGPGDDTDIGAVWIFIRTGDVWTQQGTKLVGTGAATPASQGSFVALSANGNTLAIGGPSDDTDTGAVWIFTRTAGAWTQQGSKLVGTGATGAAGQGGSVALSVDGNTLAIGGPGDDNDTGAVWIFTRSNNVWTQQGDKLVGSAVSGSKFGSAVALTPRGATLAIGGMDDDGSAGAIWIWTKRNNLWVQMGNKLVGSGATGAAQQGSSVALSANGNTLAEGGPYDNTDDGAIWIFA